MLKDFLRFNKFIAQDVLVVIYYFIAIGVPLFFVLFKNYLIKHFLLAQRLQSGFQRVYNTLNSKEKIVFWGIMVFLFLLFELFLRIIFEMVIGYFDLHEYLHQLVIRSGVQ